MAILISQNGKNAAKVEQSEFAKETSLQEYIHENPETIPVYEIRKNKKLFVLKREFSTNSGPIDALAIDQDGDIYIVETKLFKNPDKRTVVAQALDYGAALWKHLVNFDDFISVIDMEMQNKFEMNLFQKIGKFFDIDDIQAQMLIDNIRENFKNGNLKFVILMDQMDERLRDLIIYINQNSQFDIYAVQLEYYKFQENEIIIPKIFGVEVKKNIKSKTSSSSREQWNEEQFFSTLEENLGDHAQRYIDLCNYIKQKADKIRIGSGSTASFGGLFYHIHDKNMPFAIYADGSIYIKKQDDAFYSNLFKQVIKSETDVVLKKDYPCTFTISHDEALRNFAGIEKAIKAVIETKK